MKIDGLEVLTRLAIRSNLSEMASAYDVGPMPIRNGRLWNEEFRDAWHHTVQVVKVLNSATGEYRWAIRDEPFALTRGGIWTFEQSVHMRGKNLDKIRYASAVEAIEHYFAWKKRIVEKAQRMLAKNPSARLNFGF